MLTLAMMLGDWLRDVVEPVDTGKTSLQQRMEA